jgi:hypothetical protein
MWAFGPDGVIKYEASKIAKGMKIEIEMRIKSDSRIIFGSNTKISNQQVALVNEGKCFWFPIQTIGSQRP